MYVQQAILKERIKVWTTLLGILLLLSAPLWLSSCGKNSSTNGNMNSFGQLGAFNQFGQGGALNAGCALASGQIPLGIYGIYMDMATIRGGLINGSSNGQVVVGSAANTNGNYNLRGGGAYGSLGLNLLVQNGGFSSGGMMNSLGNVSGSGLLQMSSLALRDIQNWINWGSLQIPGLIYSPSNNFNFNNTNSQIASQLAVCGVGLNLSWYSNRLMGQVQVYFNGNSSQPYTMFIN